ncbi:MAG: hypothetical protein JXA92_05165 [candidate division Zixibacteria bacterium]|nr:hypothetical protein [candidate division Zixibacteria bacterium]
MKVKSLITIFLFLTFAVVPVMAGEGGETDTVEMVVTVQPDSANGLLDLELELWVFDDADTLNGVSMGFGWDNPKLQMTNAVAGQALIDGFTPPIFYDSDDIDTTNERQRFQLVGLRLFTPGVWPNPNRQLWATYFFEVAADWTTSDVIHIDTFAFNSGTKYKFVSSTGGDYFPFWMGAITITDVNPSLPKNIILSEDTLTFSAIEGGSTPPSQTFDVSSDAENFAFNLYDAATWLLKNPSSGTTPQTITVSISLVGITAGVYFDSIRVEASGVDNSPQFVYVELTVEPPPPTIGYSPGAFFFNAIAGESNPPSQTLSITNTGGSTLNWTVTSSESWLDLNPPSGSNDGDVTVTAIITGLPYGEYYDTIVVEDPNATNSPVRIPVSLSVASDLPTIEVDPQYTVIILELSELLQKDDILVVPPRTITVNNATSGTMNFWIEENAVRIDSVTPESGTAPQAVEVAFSVPDTISLGDYFDTLWVYSNEAINSPYPVVFQFHVVYDAAILDVPDTLKINIFECILGCLVNIPIGKLVVGNDGFDDPMLAQLEYESDYFNITPTEAVAPYVFNVTPKKFDLPVGAYYDSVVVSAWKALGSPDTVIIKYNIIPGVVDPEIYVADSYPYKIPIKIGSPPFIEEDFVIFNRYGGCMEWELQGSIPWATPSTTSGLNPGNVGLIIDVSELAFGSYLDTFTVISPTASNSPLLIEMLLQVWLTRGDVNFSGDIDISDIVYLIRYLYLGGDPIQPDIIVADVNCDGLYDVVDITYLIQFLYMGGPPPCD